MQVSDSTRKAEVVNSIAETISKINKAEDFTRQQDYIKQCSEILKIDETGLHAMVNNFFATGLLARRLPFEEARTQGKNARRAEASGYDDATFNLLFKNRVAGREIMRGLAGIPRWQEAGTDRRW